MELDAIARFLQDAGNDDTDDAGLPKLGLAWIARRAVLAVRTSAVARERLTMTTWCSGTGSRWAERRTSIIGEHGAHIDAAALWVHIDTESGRPITWGDEFASAYLEAAQGRLVDSKLRHPKRVPVEGDRNEMSWTFRRTDLDGFGHVNNAAYLAVLEEALGEHAPDAMHVEVEWRKPSDAAEQLTVTEMFTEDGAQMWIRSGDEIRATILARPI
jgi:acyl-ACP thioesterase